MKWAYTAIVAGILVAVTGCSDADDSADTTASSTGAASSTSSTPASTPTSAATSSTSTSPSTAPTASTVAIPANPQTATAGATIDDLLKAGRPLVIAHTGGEDEYPGSTMFAFAESVKAGVDVLDLNVLLSSDGALMIQHDETVERTSDGSGRVEQMTVAELQALDNAYWFTTEGLVDDRPEQDYLYRGIRTGEKPPPPGYTADDFAIPTLEQLIDRFPRMPLGIEIKGSGEPAQRTADALLAMLEAKDRLAATVISAFDDATIDYVHAKQPAAVISPGLNALAGWVLSNTPPPYGMRILQLPPYFGENDSIEVITDELIARSHAAGYVIWIWPNNRKFENAATYAQYLDRGIDGLNINFPTQAMDVVKGRSF